MSIRYQYDCSNIDWDAVSEILKTVGMTYYDGEKHKRAFEKSHTVVFAFDGDKLIGFGRAISDGEYEAAAYNLAVLPEYQGEI